jgi:rfaE bifunctional protein kinase chain/domain/rfaE bifunctional protein nucleotidyltransferase chain/domain
VVPPTCGEFRWCEVKKNIDEVRRNLGFSNKVTSKIIDKEDLASKCGDFPRTQRLVMCHGSFDLVHPGHLRHLAFAKSKGDLLVVSITTDEHINKANMRPYVPEELRALNLAALELVDYVVIDQDPNPIGLIHTLRPDIFVKGYEYSKGIPPKTAAEKQAVESFGGSMLFSPGDFVLSSSMVIENDPPNISLEKLLTLMQVEGLTFKDLYSSLDLIGRLSITVVGDIIVDSITDSSVIGGFRKTPTPSVRVDSHKKFVGGAGIVAKHIAATGAHVNLISVLGEDELGQFATLDLIEAGVTCHIQVAPGRPTTHKNAVVADGYRLIRIDTVENKTIEDSILAAMSHDLSSATSDCVVFSDFRHGIFNKATIPVLRDAVRPGTFTVADSQVASRWGNILDFAGCDMITPNEEEVRFAMGDQDSVIRPLGSALYELAKCKILMLKVGDRGMLTFRNSMVVDDRRSFFAIDSLSREAILDPVGSGDALLAYSTLTQIATGNETIASIMGAIAAGIECEFEGNIPITPELITKRIRDLESASDFT